MTNFDKDKVEQILYARGVDHNNRMVTFLKSYNNFTDKEFWFGFAIAYSGTDNLFSMKRKIISLLEENRKRPFKSYFMNSEERKYFKNLPNKFTVYRGMTVEEFETKDFGISWTLSKVKAEFFAFKYGRNNSTAHLPKMVHAETIIKSQVLGFINDRKEEEIVLYGVPKFLNP